MVMAPTAEMMPASGNILHIENRIFSEYVFRSPMLFPNSNRPSAQDVGASSVRVEDARTGTKVEAKNACAVGGENVSLWMSGERIGGLKLLQTIVQDGRSECKPA